MMDVTFGIAGEAFFGAALQAHTDTVREAFKYALSIALKRMYSLVNPPLSWPLPSHLRFRRAMDRVHTVIDGIIDNLAVATTITAYIEDFIDRRFVDGFVNIFADWTYGIALWFRGAETGRVRQYVMFIVVGTVGMFVLITFYLAAP